MPQNHPISVRMIDHVVIRVVDMPGMLAFYQTVLGCELVRAPGEGGLAQLRAGTALIDLMDANGPFGRKGGGEPDLQTRNMDHLCLLLDSWDFPAIRAHLENHGVVTPDPEDRSGALGVGPSIYIEDPEGNAVELKGEAPA